MSRPDLACLLLAALAGCGLLERDVAIPDDVTRDVDGARALLERGDVEACRALALDLYEDPSRTVDQRAEAAFFAAEAEMDLDLHAAALRHYKYVLENAPWSSHHDVLEDRLHELGLIFLREERYGGMFGSRGLGVEALETAQLHYSRSDRADDALRLVGDYFSEEDVALWEEAALTWERLIEEYPDSEWIERAWWRLGHCRLRMARGADYDRADLLRAMEALERSLELYPRGVAADEARADLARVREILALKELRIADFYRRRGVPRGERLRLANAALLYGDTEAGAAAAARLRSMGLSLDELRRDATLHSLDGARSGESPWSESP